MQADETPLLRSFSWDGLGEVSAKAQGVDLLVCLAADGALSSIGFGHYVLSVGKMKNNNENVVIIGLDESDYISFAYSELRNMENVHVVPKKRLVCRKIHASYKVNSIIHLPFQEKWAEFDFQSLMMSDPVSIAVFFESAEALNYDYVSYVRKSYADKLVLVLVNPIDAGLLRRVRKVLTLYDSVITCNRYDAEVYGWNYYPNCYSVPKKNDDNTSDDNTSDTDLCFIGVDKGRVEFAWGAYLRAKQLGLTCDFVIQGKLQEAYLRHDFCFISKPMSYKDYLEHIVRAKCLLEIVYQEANYCTLRTMEALTMGKVLITTNQGITREPFYNPRQVKVIATPEDISKDMFSDFDFLSKTESDNPFSPKELIKFIRAMLS